MLYTVKDSDTKHSFSWVTSVIEVVIIGCIVWAFITQRVALNGTTASVCIAVTAVYLVYATVIIRMEALTPGYTYMVVPQKYGVIFRLEVAETAPIDLFVPFVRVRKGAKEGFSLWKLSLYFQM